MGPLEKSRFSKKLYLIINVLQVEDWQFWTFPSGLVYSLYTPMVDIGIYGYTKYIGIGV